MVFKNLARRVFGDPNERDLKKYRAMVETINALEPEMNKLAQSNEALRAKTAEFKARLADGETLDDLLPEAFAVVRATAQRTILKRHYDVQLIGGMVLHDGKISEAKTGEGKTLMASLPLYLNALAGEGVHLVTPNDYLSKFGLQQMGPIYHALGLSAAVIQNYGNDPANGSFLYDPNFASGDDRYQNLRAVSRREAYQADITYGTNNEFGFDYLRDNMVRGKAEMTQRKHYFAIVDEVDNILIDEARTPLIISGTADAPSPYYGHFAKIVSDLAASSRESIGKDLTPDGDYVYDEKMRSVYLTEAGVAKVERKLKREGFMKGDNLYGPENSGMLPYLDNSLRALVMFHLDKEYMIEGGQIIIVDEFTGRPMYGRRFSEGLHQAIEAKEGVQIQRENMTLATVTFQNFFRMYEKLAGMTGTAMTEADEFLKIYKLDVVAIPTHQPNVRQDNDDLVYMNEKAKWNAIVEDVKSRHESQQPVLIGTVAIETSERLSRMLHNAKVPHVVLNAKKHEEEAGIIAQAGRPAAVTIATNMAGRGVDILLGGNPEGIARQKLRKQGVDIAQASPEQFQEALAEANDECQRDKVVVQGVGGLYVVGTERHEARRIDNQLRGRSGRQGDPGESRFYLSLEDDLMRRFGGDRVKGLMKTLKMPEDQPIEARLISSAIQQAQIRIEGFNFDQRKRVLEFDDVVNKQREVIYGQRREVLESNNLRERIESIIAETMTDLVETHWVDPKERNEDGWNPEELYRAALALYPVPGNVDHTQWPDYDEEEITLELTKGALEVYASVEGKVKALPGVAPDVMNHLERDVLLRAADVLWVRHLTDLDGLREGIWHVSVAQRDPLVEYKREAYVMWEALQGQIRDKLISDLLHIEVRVAPAPVGQAVPAAAGQAGGPASAADTPPAAIKTNLPSNGMGVSQVKAVQPSAERYAAGQAPAAPAKSTSSSNGKPSRGVPNMNAGRPTANASREAAAPITADIWSKTGRNDPCPCGSGKKYKNCHWQEQQDKRVGK
jgi:preprotein translocase subunit SecA